MALFAVALVAGWGRQLRRRSAALSAARALQHQQGSQRTAATGISSERPKLWDLCVTFDNEKGWNGITLPVAVMRIVGDGQRKPFLTRLGQRTLSSLQRTFSHGRLRRGPHRDSVDDDSDDAHDDRDQGDGGRAANDVEGNGGAEVRAQRSLRGARATRVGEDTPLALTVIIAMPTTWKMRCDDDGESAGESGFEYCFGATHVRLRTRTDDGHAR
jgi:hypothetical protein